MPNPKPDESRDDYMERCIPFVMNEGSAESNEQAAAMCNGMWDDAKAGAKTNAKLSGRVVRALFRAPADIQAKDGEPDGPKTFHVLAYSGGLLYVDDFDLPVVVDLAGLRLHKNVIANLDHKPTQRVGHVTESKNDGKTLELSGVTSAANPAREEVIGSSKDGYPWEASIEADLRRIVTIPAGKQVTVNGQTFSGPIYVSRQATLLGFAFVTHGGDFNTEVRIAASADPSKAKGKTMSEFETWATNEGWDTATLSEKQTATLQAAYTAQKPKKTVDSSLGELAATERKNAERKTRIREIVQASLRDFRDRSNYMEYVDQFEELGNKAIEEGTDPDRFELDMLRATRPAASSFTMTRARHEPNEKVLTAALCQAAGLPNIEKHFKEDVLEAVDRCGLRHFSLQQMLLKAAHANGYQSSAGERITAGNLRRVLKYAFMDDDVRPLRAAGQFSTTSLPGILGSVANKEILAGFQEEDQTWRDISAIKTVTDFKQVTAYRLTDSMEYELLPKGGEIVHGTLGEESYTRKADTYAKMLGIDRQDIINDDLGAFDDLRTRLGRGAARKFNSVFWTKFMSNLGTTFTTARGNYLAGSTTNLGTDGVGLGLGVALFRALVSADGKRVGGKPTILMVPPDVETIADALYIGGNGENQTVANTNVFKGKYKPLVVPQLTDTSYTGNSNTAWYLFRDPSILATMHVSFLNGQQTPTVESTDADFNTLGILFRGFHDFGADVAEYLAGVMLKGAA
jgi:hypothetical protein